MPSAGKLYILPSNEYEKYFPNDQSELDKVFAALYQRALLVRNQVVPIFEHMHTMKQGAVQQCNKPGYLLSGPSGCGKTAMLAHVIHAAFKNEFLVLHVPGASNWPLEQDHNAMLQPPILQGYTEHSLATTIFRFLRHFQSSNHVLLNSIPLAHSTHYYEKHLKNEIQYQTLYDLITNGLSACKFSLTLQLVMDEILVLKDIPILIAIDDYNYFKDYNSIDTTKYASLLGQQEHTDHYTLAHAIDQIIAHKRANHLIVAANTSKWKTKKQTSLQPLHIPARYSHEHVQTMMTYYNSTFWVTHQWQPYWKSMLLASDRVPRQVWTQMYLNHCSARTCL